jgi:hypothetical protein
MSRLGRDFSWHLLALAIVIAGLSVLAPLAWWNAAPGRRRLSSSDARGSVPSGRQRDSMTLGRQDRIAIPELSAEQPQVAPLGPLVADQIQIDLDPSVTETPALPVARAITAEELPKIDSTEEVRLSATLARPSQPLLPDPKAIEPINQATDPSSASPFQNPDSAFPQTKAWPHATALIEQLQALAATTPPAAAWAQQALSDLVRIAQAPTLVDPAVTTALANLRHLADEAKNLAQSVKEDQARSRILRAGYAVVRRLVIWDLVHVLAAESDLTAAPIVDLAAWTAALDKVDSLLHDTGAASKWRGYLLIDRAHNEFDSPACSPVDQRQLARDILHRMHSTQLSRAQEAFLKTPPFEAFDEQLQARAAEIPDFVGLLRAIEQYEHDDHSASAHALAAEFDLLRWSPAAGVRELAETVNAYYRNANVRVALSVDLVNRMLPPQTPQLEAVEDTVLGAWVSGQSQTNTNVRIALIPDKQHWNIGLEAVGQIATDTASSKGPATFYQKGWSMFRARKRIAVDRRGIKLFSAEAEANANNDMQDFETDFDGIPLLGGLIRAVARNQYDSSQPAAKVEVEGKIIVRATSQLDRQVAQKMEQAKQDFQVKLLKPLRDLSLEPTAVDMETTRERLIARYRIAARDQVSAQTPRPQAPSDSMLSVQLHESAMNNVLEELQLQGRRVELAELYKEMAGRFGSTRKIEVPEDLPENVFVTFADDDPVRVDCQDGRVRLTIRLKELMQSGTKNRWTNFTVHAYYVPSADQLDANLHREGIIELIGDGRPLPIGQRVALNAIFTKVLSKSRKLHVINKQISESPQLRDQQVTQFVIHDGWIGVALGPQAPGRQAAMHPRTVPERE